MKLAKKLASLLLAMVMVLAMTVTVFAEGTGQIKVENPQEGVTYTAYKIFDVSYSVPDPTGAPDTKVYAYSIAATSKWLAVVAHENDKTTDGNGNVTIKTKVTGLTFTKSANDDSYIVTVGSGFSAADLASTLKIAVENDIKNNTNNYTAIPITGGASAGNLDLGYYFVYKSGDKAGALCNLDTTDPVATINDKDDIPFTKKDDKVSADVGDDVTYTITGKVPDATGFDTYDYVITDKMSEGLTFKYDPENGYDLVVSIDGTPLSKGTDLDVDDYILETKDASYNDQSKDFVLKINVLKQQAKVGKPITVTYKATVNSKAVTKVEKNAATLWYSNDPEDANSHGHRDAHDEVYSAKIIIDKYAKQSAKPTDKTKKLAGAEFVLYKEEPVPADAPQDTLPTKKYYQCTKSGDPKVLVDVNWGDLDNATKVTTDKDGAAVFEGLANGTYYLLETKAPDGYNKLTTPVIVTVNGGNLTAEASVEQLKALEVKAEVGNNTGSELPETGGMGTTLIYVLGTILAIGAAIVLVTKRRMNAEK